MPLTFVRAADSHALWQECSTRFLDEVGESPGPAGIDAHLWVAQESQVDLLYEAAHARGVKGWLGPPVTTLRQLAGRFEIRDRRVGLLTRRRIVSRIARAVAAEVGLADPSRPGAGVVRGHMLDALFSELLPEGVSPDDLESALRDLGDRDGFARHRDQWIVGTYRGYLAELARRERIDSRQISAMVAARIDDGQLPAALRGARALHVYGLYAARSRQRLLAALGRQPEVDVRVYLLAGALDDPEASEWDGLGVRLEAALEDVAAGATGVAPAPRVQPAPDTQRETEWVARQVKRLLVEEQIEPHRIAVIARSGHDDTGRIHRALRDAGVDATTIVRAPLTEIAALKALLTLFRGAGANWDYRALRPVLDNTLLAVDIDLRTIDFIARQRRVEGLDNWEREIERLIEKLGETYESGTPRDRALRGAALYEDAVTRDLRKFRELRPILESLGAARTEAEWIDFTLQLLRNEHAAAFDLRRRLCEPVGEPARRGDGASDQEDAATIDAQRWDIVRLDQRGVRQTEVLLREWVDLDHPNEQLTPAAWRQLLHRMLEANEMSLTTPAHKGVQVLEAHDAALLPFDHVFVVHANDGTFPRRIPAGGVLSNDERARLRDAGIPLSWRDLDLRRERALWRAVTSSGDVTITYRTADPKGTPLLPSLMVPTHDERDALPRTRARREGSEDDFTPVTPAQANQGAAVALHAHLAAGEGAAPVLHPGTVELLPHAIVGAVAEAHRDTGAVPLADDAPALRPNPWNGWLRDPRVLEWLAKRFGEDYRWSPSGLEAYSKLPFQFFLDRVLRYEETAEAEEEVTPLVFGWAAHALLENFYSRVKDDLPGQFTDRAEEAFEAAAAEVLAEVESNQEWLGAEVLWEQQWKRVRRQVRAYLEWELVHLTEKNERPDLIEYGFGFEGEPVYIEGKDAAGLAARLRLCGRIDRVDHGPKGDQVLDYKSGGHPGKNDYKDGSALQAPLYMQVLEDEGRAMSSGYYRSLKMTSKRTQYGGKITRGSAVYGDALRYALSIPGRIRAGLFEPVAGMKSKGWAPWHAGRDIGRSQAQLADGNRFDDVTPLQPDPAPEVAPEPAAESPVEAAAEPAAAPAQGSLFDIGGDDV
jgi:RecB family exonuclease